MSNLDNYKTENLSSVWPDSKYHDSWIDTSGESSLVSIIIPTYNRANLIEDALDSVVAQHYRPIEVIIVDDGSEDNTEAIVGNWSKRLSADGDLTLTYHQQENQGVAHARNRGIKESRGAYVQLLDSDDKLHPKKISTQIDILKSDSTVKYVYCLTSHFGEEDDESEKMGYDISDYGLQRALVEHPYQTSAALYERDLVQRAGPFGRNLAPVDDWEFAIRTYIAAGGALVYQDEAYNHHRNSPHDRLTQQIREFHEGRLRAMCHNKKVLNATGFLTDQRISDSVSMNFVRVAFLLHELGSSRELVQRALWEACDVSNGIKSIFPYVAHASYISDTTFNMTLSMTRRLKKIFSFVL
jgi:glycosyltransferase involved in cell wall biosynthesis